MLSLGVEFFRARNDQYETLHQYYVIDKEFSWRMLDLLLISFSDLFGQATKKTGPAKTNTLRIVLGSNLAGD